MTTAKRDTDPSNLPEPSSIDAYSLRVERKNDHRGGGEIEGMKQRRGSPLATEGLRIHNDRSGRPTSESGAT